MSEDNIAILLECSLCFEPYDAEFHLPKGLPCYHTFCLECLQRLEHDRIPRLKCPECRAQHTLPAKGVKGLPSNVTITSLIELHSQSTYNDPSGSNDLKNGSNDLKKCLTKRTSDLKKQLDDFTQMNRQIRQLKSKADVVRGEIENSFKTQSEELNRRKKELCQHLDGHVHKEIESLTMKQETFRDGICKIKQFTTDIATHVGGRTGETTLVDLLKQCTDNVKLVKEMQSSLSAGIKKIMFVESGKDRLLSASNEFGKIHVSRVTNADKSTSKQRDINAPPVQVKPKRTGSMPESERYLEISSDNIEIGIPELERRGNSSSVSSTSSSSSSSSSSLPIARDRLSNPSTNKSKEKRLSVHNVPRSGPQALFNLFNLELKQTVNQKQREVSLKSKGEPKSAFGMRVLCRPHDVAVTQGKYFVTNSENHCVCVFNPSGQQLLTFGGKGMKKGQLMYPKGICTNPEGQIIVVDATLFIQVYDSVGRSIDQFGICRSKRLATFNYKSIGLDCDNDGNIFVCDPDHYCIKVLSKRGVAIREIGHHGWGDGEFKYPSGLATFQDKLIVTDLLKHCIMVFEQSGKFFCSIGSEGIALGQLREPTGVAVDDSFLIVVDAGNHRLQVLDRTGKFITTFGGKGADSGELDFPMGVVMTRGGGIVVCDSMNNRVQVF